MLTVRTPPRGFVALALTGDVQKVLGITYPDGQGEPVNAIISGNSDSEVLVDQETDGGLRNYFLCVYVVAPSS